MATDNLDLHLTQLATWLVRTVGRALMWSLLVPAALAIAAAASDESSLMFLAFVAGPLVFAWRLMGAEAPFPVEVDELVSDDASS